jgi:type VI protein secretion system component VasF
MTERRGDQGFSVAPSRVDGTGSGWRGRRRRLTTWLVLAAAAAVVVIAVLGPRLQQRPSLDPR